MQMGRQSIFDWIIGCDFRPLNSGPQLVVNTRPSLNLALLKVGATLSACQVAGAYTWPGGAVSETSWAFFVDGAAVAGSYVILPGDVLIEADVTLSATGLAPGTIVSVAPATVQNTVPHAANSANATVDVVPGDGSGDATYPAQMAAPSLASTATKITVTLAADPADGGAPITGRQYRYSTNGGTIWSAPAAISTPVTISGFVPGATAMLVQTRCVNSTDSDPPNWSTSASIDMKIPVLVGKKTFSPSRNSTDNNISLTDLTGGLAAAPAAGDLVVIGYGTGSIANRAITVLAADGYTPFIAKIYQNNTEDLNFYTGYKFMGSTPDTSVNVTGTLNSSDAGAIVIEVWRYLDPAALDVAVVSTVGSGGQPIPGAITPVSQHALIFVLGCGAGVTCVDFTSADLSNFAVFTGNGTHDVAVGIGTKDWTTGAFTAAQFGGGEASAANARAAVVAAFKPL